MPSRSSIFIGGPGFGDFFQKFFGIFFSKKDQGIADPLSVDTAAAIRSIAPLIVVGAGETQFPVVAAI